MSHLQTLKQTNGTTRNTQNKPQLKTLVMYYVWKDPLCHTLMDRVSHCAGVGSVDHCAGVGCVGHCAGVGCVGHCGDVGCVG